METDKSFMISMILEVSGFDLHASSCALDGPVNSRCPLHLNRVCVPFPLELMDRRLTLSHWHLCVLSFVV